MIPRARGSVERQRIATNAVFRLRGLRNRHLPRRGKFLVCPNPLGSLVALPWSVFGAAVTPFMEGS